METATSGTIRVQNTERYTLVMGYEEIHLKCRECEERRKPEWIHSFQTKGLPGLLNVVISHDETFH